jgi:hypothetical protein
LAEWFGGTAHEGEWSAAGYNTFGADWTDVQNGGTPLESWARDSDLSELERVTIHYVNEHGDDIYVTMHGPWEDWGQFMDYIDYILDPYGVS